MRLHVTRRLLALRWAKLLIHLSAHFLFLSGHLRQAPCKTCPHKLRELSSRFIAISLASFPAAVWICFFRALLLLPSRSPTSLPSLYLRAPLSTAPPSLSPHNHHTHTHTQNKRAFFFFILAPSFSFWFVFCSLSEHSSDVIALTSTLDFFLILCLGGQQSRKRSIRLETLHFLSIHTHIRTHRRAVPIGSFLWSTYPSPKSLSCSRSIPAHLFAPK